MSEEGRYYRGLLDASLTEVSNVIRASIRLKTKMYQGADTKDELFRLRKALEDIWGHDIPTDINPSQERS